MVRLKTKAVSLLGKITLAFQEFLEDLKVLVCSLELSIEVLHIQVPQKPTKWQVVKVKVVLFPIQKWISKFNNLLLCSSLGKCM